MSELVRPDMISEYENFISSHKKGHFMQSCMWGDVKSDWKWDAVISRSKSGDIAGSMALLTRKIPYLPYTIMYSPRGPVCDIHDKAVIADLLSGVRDLAKTYKAYVFKIDPDVLSDDTEFIKIMTELGLTLPNSSQNVKNFEAIQPRYVFRLNVEGKSEEELMDSFHSKTRYNIRLAERKGVTVKICGKEMLPDFSRIMLETGLRDGFVTRPQAYFEKMMDKMGDNVRLYMAFLDGKPISGTLASHFGDKVWYMYGASSNEYRNVMPNYLLQWHMIKWALEEKCRIYDFRGVSGDISEDNPLYGLYRFKKGFNGDFCEFVGEFDMVFRPAVALAVKHGGSAFKKLRRAVFLRKNRGKVQSSSKDE